MTVAVEQPQAAFSTREDFFSLDHASWELYELMLRDLGESHVRITFDQGRMVLMSPLPRHERTKRFIGQLIELATLDRNIPRASLGSTTWRRKDLGKGLEGDECYYIQHESQVRGKDDIDLRRDPPPDLAVEVDITHHPLDRLAIYGALGVPEIWHYDGQQLQFLVLRGNEYEKSADSAALPFLKSDDINRFLAMFATSDETSVLVAFRDWLAQV